jgi:hypothetical protein
MRKDMAKVVTESPRRGHSNRSSKWGRRLTKDEYALDDHGARVAHPSRVTDSTAGTRRNSPTRLDRCAAISGRACGRPRPRTRRRSPRPRSASAGPPPPTTPTTGAPAPAAAPAAAHTARRFDEIPTPRSVRSLGLLSHRADHVLPEGPGKSAAKPRALNELMGALVLCDSRGKSAAFSCGIKQLARLLVLSGDEQDSTEMTEEIRAGHPKGCLGDIPGQLRQRGREHQRQHHALGLLSLEPATLYAMGDEVVGVTTTPRGLRARAPRGLTRRR